MTLYYKGVEVSHYTGLFWAWGGKGCSCNKIWIYPPSVVMKRKGMRIQNSLLIELVRKKG